MLIVTYIKLLALSLLQDKIIFVPKVRGMEQIKEPVEYGFTDAEDKIVLAEDGAQIHYWIKHPADKNKPYLVFFHGNAGHFGDLRSLTEKGNNRGYRLQLLHDFADKGYGFIAVSLRGYGKSSGKPSEAGFRKDVKAVAEIIRQNNYKTLIFGESLGAFSALVMMQELEQASPPEMVVLMAPFSNLEEKAREIHAEFSKFDLSKYLKHQFDNQKIIEETGYKGKILLFHPSEDEVSGPYHSNILLGEGIKAGRDIELIMLKNAGHVSWNVDEVAAIMIEKLPR